MRNKHDAPNYVADGQTLSAGEAIVLILSMLLLPLINDIESQVVVGKVIIHILMEMGSIEARGACPCAAPG